MTTNSESGATTELDDEQKIHLLTKGNIPSSARTLTSAPYKRKADLLLAYLASAKYSSDLLEGRGVCLTGDAGVRSNLFILMAKTFAYSQKGVWFCSVNYLLEKLENGEADDKGKLARIPNLFVEWFEREFRDDGCPYTQYQRMQCEEFLLSRSRAGHITNFTSSSDWGRMKWWSPDFQAALADKVTNIRVG